MGADQGQDVIAAGPRPARTLNRAALVAGPPFDGALWANYTHSYYDDFRFDPAAIPVSARVSSWTVLNASWGWNIDDVHRVAVRVENLTDRDPPRALGASAWVDTYNHDAMGRFVTLNWIGRF